MLASPIVAGPLSPCNALVVARGTFAGAKVHVYATSQSGASFTSRHVGTAVAAGPETEVPLSSALQPNERVVASQILGTEVGPEIPGALGEPVTAVPRVEDLGGLFCAETLLDCATCFWVNGVIPGATVRVTINSGAPLVATVQTDRAKFVLGSGGRLRTGDAITAQQTACGIVGATVSLPSPVAQRRSAWPAKPPVLDGPLVQCQSSLRLSEILPGATVVLDRDGEVRRACFASTQGRFGVSRRLKAGEHVAVRQEFAGCELVSLTGGQHVSSDNPEPPGVEGPVCEGDRTVRLAGLIDGARFEIAADARPLCTGVASDTTGTAGIPVILGTKELTIRQSACDGELGTWSDWSLPTPVRPLGPQSRPTIVPPLVAGGVAVGVVGLKKGSVVEVVSPFGVVGHTTSNGDERVDVPLWLSLVLGDKVRLRTTRCGAAVEWFETVVVGARVDVAPPDVATPACDCGGSVLVKKTVPGAIVEVYREDPGPPHLLLGTARAGDTTVSVDVPPLSGNERLVATQRLGAQRSSAGAVAGMAHPPVWHYKPNTAFRLFQFTKDADPGDRPHPIGTTQFSLNGTDLGVSVEHGGRLYFFFGDAAPFNDTTDEDPIAWMTTVDPDDLEFWPEVHWVVNGAGRFQPLTVEGQTLGNFEVPTGAFSWDGHLYVFVARNKMEDPSRMTTSTLVVRDPSQWDFKPVLQISSTTGGQILVLQPDGSLQPAPYPGRRWMLHISPTVVANADWPGLPPSASSHGLLMFGASAYRGVAPDVTPTELTSGNVYLAWAPLTSGVVPPHSPIPPADQWQFFKGLSPSGTPSWSTLSAGDPIPVISNVLDGPRLLGELGVVWYPGLRRWVVAGTGGTDPQGAVNMARLPWGPWNARESVCDAGQTDRDAGNGLWQWTDANVTYAPYLIRRWLRWDRSTRRARLHFALSGFDDREGKPKYQPQLVRSEVVCWP